MIVCLTLMSDSQRRRSGLQCPLERMQVVGKPWMEAEEGDLKAKVPSCKAILST